MSLGLSSVDILWTVDGDFFLGDNSDLSKASSYKDEVLESAILRRLQSSSGDWALIPNFPGANLTEFIGLPNTPETAVLIKSAIVDTLTFDNLIRGHGLDVDVVPIGLREVMVVLVIPSLEKKDKPLVFGFSYDLRDNKMVPRIVNL